MRPSSHNTAWHFYGLSALTGVIGSLVHPLMSLFIVEGLQSPPAYLAIYTLCVTCAGICASHGLGVWVDKGMNAKTLYILSVSCIALALTVYAKSTNFWWVIGAGVTLMAIGNAAVPQMLALGRQWVNTATINANVFNARVRASISFAWIGGPPLAFFLASTYSFSQSFLLSAGCAVIAALFVWRYIPASPPTSASQTKHTHQASIPRSFWLLGGAVSCGMMSNLMYSSSLPLYTLKELGFEQHWPGVFMGLVAALEIPFMLYAGKLSEKNAKATLLGIAFGLGAFFYLGIFFATDVWHFMALQVLNAAFYGLYAGVGLTLMQEQLPDRVGFTSACYSNAMKIGMMLGTAGTGLIGQLLGFRFASLGCMLIAALGLCCLLGFQKQKAIEQERYS